jgi:MuDR family transposase
MILVEVGVRFKNKEELKRACQTLATRGNFEYSVVKSDRSRLILKCIGEGCPWRLHASKVVDGNDPCFEVKTINTEHNCRGVHHLGHRQATAKFIGSQIQAKLNDNSSYRPINITQDIRRELGIQMTYAQAHRAKQQALQAINGTEEEAFAAMPKYCEDLKRNNPGSTIILECTEEEGNQSRFNRVFICYGASAIGFGFCCPVLGLDGTHLKNKYRGVTTLITTNGRCLTRCYC